VKNIRLLMIAIVLIIFGITGIVAIHRPVNSQFGMPGRMMTSGGMMDRAGMKERMQRMMPDMLPLGITTADLPSPNSPGAKLLVLYCTQCHSLPSPSMHTAEQWPAVNSRMFSRMSMMSGMMGMMKVELPSSEEQRTIVSYLKTNAMRSLAPSKLPDPGSQGAVLFNEMCSQCHPLPDPKLHTADEWPKIVDRMQSNTRSMGKKVITGNEKTDVVGYLTRYGRR
jgi:cytochrome c5